MILKTFDINLDIANSNVVKKNWSFTTGDTDVYKINFSMFDGTGVLTLTGISTSTVTFHKADGNTVTQGLVIVSASLGTLACNLVDSNCYSVSGAILGNLQLYGASGERISSNRFSFNSQSQLDDGNAIASTTNYTILTELMVDVQDLFDNMQHQGAYATATTYYQNNVVSYNGSSYMEIATSSLGNLPTDPLFWQLVASKGDTGVTGTTGIQGVTGVTGVTGIQGTKGIIWEGNYVTATLYTPDDAVYYVDSSYICIATSVGNGPVSGAFWNMLASVGATGTTGATGVTGATGLGTDVSGILTTQGDLLYATGANDPARLAKGASSQYLLMSVGATSIEWVDSPQSLFTSRGDIIYATAANSLGKLTMSTTGKVLGVASGATGLVYMDSPQSLLTTQGDLLYATGANDPARLAKGATGQFLGLTTGATSIMYRAISASDVVITDAGGYFTGTDVEAALQELYVADYSSETSETAAIISLPSTVVKGGFNVLTLDGNTVTNKLALIGDCGTLADFTRVSCTGALSTTSTLFGTSALQLTLEATSGYAYLPATSYLITGEYYLISAYGKVATAIDVSLRFESDDQDITSTAVSGTAYTRMGIVIAPTDFDTATTASIRLLVTGATGNIAYFDGIMMNSITSAEYLLGATSLLNKYNYVNNTVSTLSVALRSVNKNLLKDFEEGTINASGVGTASTLLYRSKSYIPVKSSTAYTFSLQNSSNQDLSGIHCYDINRQSIGEVITSGGTKTVTTLAETKYIRYLIRFTSGNRPTLENLLNINKPQLEEGSVATTYVEHEFSEAIVEAPFNDGELTQVPNGSADEIDISSGKATQNNQKYTLLSGDVTAVDNVTFSNVTIALVQLGVLASTGTATVVDGKVRFENRSEIISSVADDTAQIGNFYYGDTRVRVLFAKNTTLGQAQTALAGTTLIYQTVLPVIYELPPQALIAHPNGTITITPTIRFSDNPSTGVLTIPDSTNPLKEISSVDSVVDMDTGEVVGYDSFDDTTVTLNAGYDDTHVYKVVYLLKSENTTVGSLTYSYPLNLIGGYESNVEAIGELSMSLSELWLYVIGGL